MRSFLLIYEPNRAGLALTGPYAQRGLLLLFGLRLIVFSACDVSVWVFVGALFSTVTHSADER